MATLLSKASDIPKEEQPSDDHRGWSLLPDELLDLIVVHITDPRDLSSFGRVCASWRSTAARSCRPPLLAASSNRRDWTLFALSEQGNKFHQLPQIPIRLGDEEYCCGCSMGWFLVTQNDPECNFHKMHLVNPISGEQVGLPLLSYRSGRSEWDIQHAILSSAPTSDDCVIAVARGQGRVLSLCRPGIDDEWATFDSPDDLYQWDSMIFHKGMLYCLSIDGSTDVFGFDLRMMSRIDCPVDRRHWYTFHHWLLESEGQLLQVVSAYDVAGDCSVFLVFGLRKDEWVRLRSLCNRVLFIGWSMEESISLNGFTATGFARPNYVYHLKGSYVNAYSMEDGRSESIPVLERDRSSVFYWIRSQMMVV